MPSPGPALRRNDQIGTGNNAKHARHPLPPLRRIGQQPAERRIILKGERQRFNQLRMMRGGGRQDRLCAHRLCCPFGCGWTGRSLCGLWRGWQWRVAAGATLSPEHSGSDDPATPQTVLRACRGFWRRRARGLRSQTDHRACDHPDSSALCPGWHPRGSRPGRH